MTELSASRTVPAPLRIPSARWLIAAWPSIFVAAIVLTPLILLLQISFAHREVGGLWSPGLELTQYGEVFNLRFFWILCYSMVVATVVATAALCIGLPLTYLICGMSRKWQVIWLVGILTTLTFSEVLVVFSWQVMLSKNVILFKFLVSIGVISPTDSLYPGYAALLSCLIYMVLPFAVTMLYAPLSRIDSHLVEAAMTMGAGPIRVFFTVVMPLMFRPLTVAFVVLFIFTIGAYVTPTALARPDQWTVGVSIGNSVMESGNMPLGAAQAIVFLAVVLALSLGLLRATKGVRGAE